MAAARNFLAVERVATPRRSSLSAKVNTRRAKFSVYAEEADSTSTASEGPMVVRRDSSAVRRDERKARLAGAGALRAMPT